MAGRGEEDMEILPHVPVKPLIPAIPTDDREFRETERGSPSNGLRRLACPTL